MKLYFMCLPLVNCRSHMLEAKLNIDNTYVRVDGVNTQKWQKLVDMLAELFNAASADIVEYKGDHFNVLTTSVLSVSADIKAASNFRRIYTKNVYCRLKWLCPWLEYKY